LNICHYSSQQDIIFAATDPLFLLAKPNFIEEMLPFQLEMEVRFTLRAPLMLRDITIITLCAVYAGKEIEYCRCKSKWSGARPIQS
jgi:hypothetical protein